MSKPKGPPAQTSIPHADRNRAPVVFFNQSSTGAYAHGIVSLTLSADVFTTAEDGTVATEHAVVAHLKTSVLGAKTLRAMLDRALLLAEPTAGEAN